MVEYVCELPHKIYHRKNNDIICLLGIQIQSNDIGKEYELMLMVEGTIISIIPSKIIELFSTKTTKNNEVFHKFFDVVEFPIKMVSGGLYVRIKGCELLTKIVYSFQSQLNNNYVDYYHTATFDKIKHPISENFEFGSINLPVKIVLSSNSEIRKLNLTMTSMKFPTNRIDYDKGSLEMYCKYIKNDWTIEHRLTLFIIFRNIFDKPVIQIIENYVQKSYIMLIPLEEILKSSISQEVFKFFGHWYLKMETNKFEGELYLENINTVFFKNGTCWLNDLNDV